MTGALLAVGLLVLLVGGGLLGPRVLDRLSLTNHPRAGIAVWTGAVAIWTLALLALGPLLAWSLSGPGLPGAAGAVCRRCLEAASPFGAAAPPLALPPALAMGISALVSLALLVAMARTFLRSRRDVGDQRSALEETATVRTAAGSRVWLLGSEVPVAYALPGRGVSIVVSEGTLAALNDDQLGAVLSHENAHLRGRHHLVLAVLRAVRSVLGVVPLIGAAPVTVAAYAEMAADDAARRSHGTRALAAALLVLGSAGAETPHRANALHAAQSQVSARVQRLAGHGSRAGRLATALAGGYLLALAAAVTLVVGPYAAAITGGLC